MEYTGLAEIEHGTANVVDMDGQKTVLRHPAGELAGRKDKTFTYDHSFWSADHSDPSKFAGALALFLLSGHKCGISQTNRNVSPRSVSRCWTMHSRGSTRAYSRTARQVLLSSQF